MPEDVTFATKPEVARRMLARVRAAGLPAAWVTGDTVYGGNPALCAWLEEQRQPYVLAVAANDGVDLPYGETTRHVVPEEIAQYALDAPDWRRRSAGDGTKGARLYDWALVPLATPSVPGFEQALLIRRPVDAPDDPRQLAYYLTFAPVGTLFETVVAVAGRRWTVEESLEAAKGEVGLDHYAKCGTTTAGTAISRWPCWPWLIWRWCGPACPGPRSRGGARLAELAAHGKLIPLTVPEVRRLVYRLVLRVLAPPEAVLHWSRWRRRHQASAPQGHYRRRLAQHRRRKYAEVRGSTRKYAGDTMPLALPARDPCPYCENLAGRYAWHGPPAVVAEDGTTYVFLAPASLGGLRSGGWKDPPW